MQWLRDLVASLGTSGACANAARSLAAERDVAAQIDRFLLRFDLGFDLGFDHGFDHGVDLGVDRPAGQPRISAEPPAGLAVQVA